MAPLEGLTGYLFRTTYEKYFGEIDKYFTPFISPSHNMICRTRERKDILPENNQNMKVVPQILTNNSEIFGLAVDYLSEYGYHEFNINLGCPMGTVVSKKKGAGFLSDPDQLKYFLDDIYLMRPDIEVSLKTRIGVTDSEEFSTLIDIFNSVPLKELIVHPRTREDFYNGHPDYEAFSYAYHNSTCDVCYNGDVNNKEDMAKIQSLYPNLDRVMIGRGILRYPGLIVYMKTGIPMTKDKLKSFHDELYGKYKENMYGDKPVLFKCKELWTYMIHSFEDSPKILKKIKKAQRLTEYESIIEELFSQKRLIL